MQNRGSSASAGMLGSPGLPLGQLQEALAGLCCCCPALSLALKRLHMTQTRLLPHGCETHQREMPAGPGRGHVCSLEGQAAPLATSPGRSAWNQSQGCPREGLSGPRVLHGLLAHSVTLQSTLASLHPDLPGPPSTLCLLPACPPRHGNGLLHASLHSWDAGHTGHRASDHPAGAG